MNIFNLLSKTNETRFRSWHETCMCKCRLDASICNNRQSWNNDKCRCKCKELIDKGRCNNGFIWNPNVYKCEYDKLRDVDEHLDYINCKCIKKVIDKLAGKCDEDINGNEMVYNATLYDS